MQLWYSLLPNKYCESRGEKVNKAHTVEYAHICYYNAYYKANYPTEFYTALLNSESGDAKRKAVIIRDMMRHNVKLLPPLVTKSDVDFTMTDPETIRFGLAAIKGLGEKGLASILDEKKIRGPFTSVENFRARVPSTLCNVNVMTSLAKCGAFDDIMGNCILPIKNRATMVASMKEINDGVNALGRKKGKDKPKPTVDDVLAKIASRQVSYSITEAGEDLIEYATWEKEVLNFFISAHPLDAYTDEMERWTAIGDTDMEDLPKEFYIAGFVGGCHETVIKKEGRNQGKTMAFVTIECESRSYEITLFPGVYESCMQYIKTGEPVVAKCKRDSYKDAVSIQGLYMRRMTNSGIRDCPECHIRLYDYSFATMLELKGILDEHPGVTKVYFHVTHGHHDMTIEINQSISLNDRIIQYCDKIGRISYKPI